MQSAANALSLWEDAMRTQHGSRSKTAHSTYHSMAGLTTALVMFLLFSTIGRGADRIWSNSTGGVFSTLSNWQGGTVPSSSDTANFTLNSATPYTVTLSAGASVAQLMLDQDNVLLDLSGFTLTASTGTLTAPSLVVSETAGGISSLDVRNGTLVMPYAKIGDYGTGTVTLSNAA